MNHGIVVQERATALTAPKASVSAALAAIVTAPVNMLENPQSAVNVPLYAQSAAEMASLIGFSTDPAYTSNQVLDIFGSKYDVGPISIINVLDPTKHKTTFSETSVPVDSMQATVKVSGILRDGLTVKAGESSLTADTDYTTAYDNAGYLLVNLVPGGAGASATTLSVSGSKLDPSAVKKEDIIGAVNASTGVETGMELIRQIYPKYGVVPALLIAPGYSHIPEVGIALSAKAAKLNEKFHALALLDLDTTATGARIYTDVKQTKEKSGYTSEFCVPTWGHVRVGSSTYPMSIMLAAAISAMDSDNGGVPYVSPSNRPIPATGLCLADGTDIYLSQSQANAVNAAGVMTAINENGWRTWGNYTGAYPASGDPKDFWVCTRRMFNWYEVEFAANYASKVDQPMSKRLIQSFVDSENQRMSAYVARGEIAAFSLTYRAESNPGTDIIAGNITFDIMFAPFTPAQSIKGSISFDVDALQSAIQGG